MSQVFSFSGNDDFYPGGRIYPNPKEPCLFLSLGRSVDYFPLQKRSRFSVPFDINREWFDEPKQKASIESLPDECLFEILRRLPVGQDRSVCASVSKRWLMLLSSICENENCNNGSTIGDNVVGDDDDEGFSNEGYLSRSLEGMKATDVRLAAIAVGTASRGGLGKLTIRGCNSDRGMTNVGLKAIAHGCPSLKVFSVFDVATIDDEGLIEIASGCHKLEKLDLCKCPNISDKTLIAISKKCPNLAELSIESCPNIGNEGLQAIGKLCSNLRSVSIKGCSGVGDQGVCGLMSSASYVLSKVKLESLMVSDLSLATIGHYGFQVTNLVLSDLPNVSEKGFWVMGNGRGLQKLNSITIECCQGLTDTGIEAIGKGCPNVKNFQLRKCAYLSDKGLVSLTRAALSIESLKLHECHRITQIGLFGVFFHCAAKLKVLTLISCYGIKDLEMDLPAISPSESFWSLTIRDCPGFGDANLALLGKLCPRLKHVELSGLQRVTDVGFLPLLECSETGLTTVNLRGCLNVTDRVVLSIVNSYGWTLQVLCLDGCTRVTDASMMAIAGNCPVLSDLDVSKCAITDTGIVALASGKQFNLEILSLAGCISVSDNSMAAFKKLGQSLAGLNIKRCSAISSRGVSKLQEHLWTCDILN
ncbi:EIN3-binding F-box protein 1 [Vigna radiata var. radiata]|uniref:EIN3-binding F-box protein 1 n=1 Tax=Vigna radiata var. radiata TaxID=3916 RepID=A0A1S3U651_VIGRR|nr:EIN3-binding F-box protein 1 [Vigna radiata var. radiata]XP_014501470.1 EIN3-binding F-box protein 1 [Vigna radiata var. radiata]